MGQSCSTCELCGGSGLVVASGQLAGPPPPLPQLPLDDRPRLLVEQSLGPPTPPTPPAPRPEPLQSGRRSKGSSGAASVRLAVQTAAFRAASGRKSSSGTPGELGLRAWRIEDKRIAPWGEALHGDLCESDTYVILQTVEDTRQRGMQHNLFYWVGNESSAVDPRIGTSKPLADLCGALSGEVTECVELQGSESAVFRALLPSVRYVAAPSSPLPMSSSVAEVVVCAAGGASSSGRRRYSEAAERVAALAERCGAQVTRLYDESATGTNLKCAIREAGARCAAGGCVVLYYAGRGTLVPEARLSASGTLFEVRRASELPPLRGDDLAELLVSCTDPKTRTLLLMDCDVPASIVDLGHHAWAGRTAACLSPGVSEGAIGVFTEALLSAVAELAHGGSSRAYSLAALQEVVFALAGLDERAQDMLVQARPSTARFLWPLVPSDPCTAAAPARQVLAADGPAADDFDADCRVEAEPQSMAPPPSRVMAPPGGALEAVLEVAEPRTAGFGSLAVEEPQLPVLLANKPKAQREPEAKKQAAVPEKAPRRLGEAPAATAPGCCVGRRQKTAGRRPPQ